MKWKTIQWTSNRGHIFDIEWNSDDLTNKLTHFFYNQHIFWHDTSPGIIVVLLPIYFINRQENRKPCQANSWRTSNQRGNRKRNKRALMDIIQLNTECSILIRTLCFGWVGAEAPLPSATRHKHKNTTNGRFVTAQNVNGRWGKAAWHDFLIVRDFC